jgi:hypothetical protein
MTDAARAIKPCPFCGSKADFEYDPWNDEDQSGDDGSGYVECSACDASISGYVDDVIEKWNSRPSKPTCQTCKHRDAGGYCNSDKLQEDWGNCTEDQKSDMLLYSFMESGRFWTGPNFGCIHHAEKGLTTLTATPHKA